MRNLKIRKLLPVLVTVVILVGFGYYLYVNIDQYLHLLSVSPGSILELLGLSLAMTLLNSIQNTYVYRGLGIANFSHRDSYLITSASTLINQLPIPGGIISRAYYLKRKHNLSYTKFTSSTLALFFCFMSVSGLIGICALLFISYTAGIRPQPVLLISFAGMMGSILIFWVPLHKLPLPSRLRAGFLQAIEGWQTIGKNPNLLFIMITLQIMMVIFLSLRYLIAFRMLSQNVSLGQTLLFAGATVLTQLVSIAPGGLGVREAIVAAVASIIGFDPVVSVVAVSLDRLVMTTIIVLTGWVSSIYLGKEIQPEGIE